jgi:phosphocarrier protein FPr
MVSIVLVSHSKELAAAVKALADQQTQNRTPIATAAGIDDAQQPFGTDPLEIVEAIRSVWSADGVLVLMDLGSAVMSATVAMDLLEPGQAAVVQLVAAPFVEGAMAAGSTKWRRRQVAPWGPSSRRWARSHRQRLGLIQRRLTPYRTR